MHDVDTSSFQGNCIIPRKKHSNQLNNIYRIYSINSRAYYLKTGSQRRNQQESICRKQKSRSKTVPAVPYSKSAINQIDTVCISYIHEVLLQEFIDAMCNIQL